MLPQLLSLALALYPALATPTPLVPDTPSAPLAARAAKPLTLASTFLYELDRKNIAVPTVTSKTGVKVNADVYIVDMENHSKAELQRYKDAGKTVICYFSAGTWEPYRADKEDFLPECYCGPNVKTDSAGVCTGTGKNDNLLGEWNEWWLNLRTDKCRQNVRAVQQKRILAAKAKGCDGLDPDNVDSYTNSQKHGNTVKDQYDYLMWLSQTIHAQGMLVDLKNSPDLIQHKTYGPAIVNAFDFGVIEECAAYNECSAYDPFLRAGKPQIQVEYSGRLKSCPSASAQPKGRSLAVYKGLTLDSQAITLNCPTRV